MKYRAHWLQFASVSVQRPRTNGGRLVVHVNSVHKPHVNQDPPGGQRVVVHTISRKAWIARENYSLACSISDRGTGARVAVVIVGRSAFDCHGRCKSNRWTAVCYTDERRWRQLTVFIATKSVFGAAKCRGLAIICSHASPHC